MGSQYSFKDKETACAKDDDKSIPVYVLTNSEEQALSSIRISISYLTTKEEIDTLLKCLVDDVNKLLSI